MAQYSDFARVYDTFMNNIPYEEWAMLVANKLKEYNGGRKVLELGCGTGTFSFLMEKKGYEVVGIDCAPDMVKEAIKKAKKNKSTCKFELQDMRVIEQEELFDSVISVCDSINYLSEEFDLQSTFDGAFNVLKDGGIFMFDMKTEEFYKSLGENIFVDENEEGCYIWKNFYDEETRDNSYELTFFIKKKKDLYTKVCEEHVQHVFYEEEILRCAKNAGFVLKEKFGDGEAKQREYYIFERKYEDE